MGFIDFFDKKLKLLVVDDDSASLNLLTALLNPRYHVMVANNGYKAVSIVLNEFPDLILLDIEMPDVNGYEVCRQIKSNLNARHIPIIFLTAKNDILDEKFGLSLGAVDYIVKPISPPILLARIETHLQLKLAYDFLREENKILELEVKKRSKDIIALQEVIILAMATLAETRDPETGNHIKRTQHYINALATYMQSHSNYSSELNKQYIDLLFKSAPLHDIGKVGIPDHILLKPSKLTSDEFEVMKTHTIIGYKAITYAEANLGISESFLSIAKDISLYHHEKWDGSGYPFGLSGVKIPLSARMMAVCDVYDALVNRRVYKSEMSHESAVQLIFDGREGHFDPDVIDAFIAISPQFKDIAERFSD